MEMIPFHRPYIGKEEEAALRVLRSGWLTTGKETLAFEEEFRSFLLKNDSHRKDLFCLAVNSATSGLHLALEALGIGAGDTVLLPSYTFTATAEVVRYLGAELVFVDIAEDSFNMDTQALEKTITKIEESGQKPKVILPVHIGGLPCDMAAINSIAENHGLSVVEDAAHAFPARTSTGLWAGCCGDLGVFSFYATKTITTGEGGMVVTGRKELANRISIMRSHGIDRSVWNRYTDTEASWYYEVVEPGFKYNLPDLLAAVGRVQLSRAAELLAMREKIAARYDSAFAGQPAFITPPPGGARHLYSVRLRETEKRDLFIASLREAGIGTSVHYIPLHIMPYYRERYGLKPDDFPNSFKRFTETVSLPIWPGMTDEQIDRVIEAVSKILKF